MSSLAILHQKYLIQEILEIQEIQEILEIQGAQAYHRKLLFFASVALLHPSGPLFRNGVTVG